MRMEALRVMLHVLIVTMVKPLTMIPIKATLTIARTRILIKMVMVLLTTLAIATTSIVMLSTMLMIQE